MNAAEYEAMFRVEDHLWWYTGMRRIAAQVMGERLAGAGRRLAILDAGCGTGGNLSWLARYGAAYGVDLSPLAIAFCAQRHLTTVSRASVVALPYRDSTFDLVTSFDVIYHLGVRDDVAALAEMRRVLRPGGWTYVRVPALEPLRSEHDAAVHTRQRYDLAELTDKTRRAGLEVVRATYANTLLLPIAATSRLLARLRRRGDRPNHGMQDEPEAARSDVHPVPAAVNAALATVLRVEAALLGRLDLPIGLSAVILARRPDDEGVSERL